MAPPPPIPIPLLHTPLPMLLMLILLLLLAVGSVVIAAIGAADTESIKPPVMVDTLAGVADNEEGGEGVNDDVSAGVVVVVRAAVTLAAVVTIFEHIVVPRMDGVQNVFSLSELGDDTSTSGMRCKALSRLRLR